MFINPNALKLMWAYAKGSGTFDRTQFHSFFRLWQLVFWRSSIRFSHIFPVPGGLPHQSLLLRYESKRDWGRSSFETIFLKKGMNMCHIVHSQNWIKQQSYGKLHKPFRNALSLGNIWLVPPNTDTMLSLILCSEQRDAHTQWHSTMHSWIWTRRCSNTVHQYIVESEHAFSSTYVWMLSLMLCFEQRDAHSLSITILQFNSIALCVSLTHSTMLLVESEGAFSSTYV